MDDMGLFDDVSEADIAKMTESDVPDEGTKPSEPEAGTGENEVKNDQAANEGEGETKDAKPSEPEESYTLKHLGKEVKVNREELIITAQKGLDYDRVRGSYDRIEGLARQSGVSVDEFLSTLDQRASETVINNRMQELLGSGEYSESAARKMAEMEYRLNQQEKAAQERKEVKNREQAFRKQIGDFVLNNPEFMQEFPDAQIPQEMVDSINGGMSMDGAWAKYQLGKERKANEEMKRQLAEYEQQKKNSESAAPNVNSQVDGGEKDPFLEGLMASRW